MSNFNEAAVLAVFSAVESYALKSGRFDHVNQHEPKSGPGTGVLCSIWIQAIRPIRASGVAATSGLVVLQSRIYMDFLSQPYDMIDPKITAAVADLMGAISGDFEFGSVANVRMVDLLGAYFQNGLNAQAGYVEIDRQIYRVMTVSIPVVINDMFMQVA